MISLSIATPERIFFKGQVSTLSLPGSCGYMQILPNHAPLITSLQQGTLSFVTEDRNQMHCTIQGGIFEFSNNQAIVLLDSTTSFISN